ncbi:hypothetical protein [Pectobacterium aroidearum]|uniref:hypothetical protein n=1 Tax=Pectobacterium aroidearum TaxID=1201031 RepID=UPI002A82CAB0|nr:hypothetical protein [Pectobacterium aroidearum]MDY4388729.1 hypothetical protein [Pectobacterium aroidearum]
MSLLKMLIAALGKVITWYSSAQAQDFVAEHLRQAGYNDEEVEAAREAAFLLVGAITTTIMNFILRTAFTS